jgi:hypothetical protein
MLLAPGLAASHWHCLASPFFSFAHQGAAVFLLLAMAAWLVTALRYGLSVVTCDTSAPYTDPLDKVA